MELTEEQVFELKILLFSKNNSPQTFPELSKIFENKFSYKDITTEERLKSYYKNLTIDLNVISCLYFKEPEKREWILNLLEPLHSVNSYQYLKSNYRKILEFLIKRKEPGVKSIIYQMANGISKQGGSIDIDLYVTYVKSFPEELENIIFLDKFTKGQVNYTKKLFRLVSKKTFLYLNIDHNKGLEEFFKKKINKED